MLSAGQKQLRLNNMQINMAAGKVIKKKKMLDHEGQNPPAPIRVGGKSLLAQKQPRVIFNAPNAQANAANAQPGLQKVLKHNLIRVKQTQIEFDKQSKQHLNIKLITSGKVDKNGGSSKRVGPVVNPLQLQKQQTAVVMQAQIQSSIQST